MNKRELQGVTHQLIEWEYISKKSYSDPFNALELDVCITAPSGKSWVLPSFWRRDLCWAVRFIPEEVGSYSVHTQCSDKYNNSLHHVTHVLEVVAQTSKTTSVYRNLSISPNKHHLEDTQGNAFFWLADTWWMGLSSRLTYPKDFYTLTADRKEKGFSVIQLVIGLFPDMNHFDSRCENEGGLPWEDKYARINPAYFDTADKRIAHLVASNLIPCILGAWGYYIHQIGESKMKQHWRYIVARWGVYPVVWCIAGEGAMPYYLSTNGPRDRDRQIKQWTNIGQYIKQIDPFGHLITIHPTDTGRTQISDETLLDFNMLQAGHSGYSSISNAMKLIDADRKALPTMPSIMSEVNYEGIMHDTSTEVQRLTFWTSILTGAAGFTYGANGIWQVNTKETPFGASPHGGTWGNTPWEEAMECKGSKQLGLAKRLLEKYEWWNIKPHQEWITPEHTPYDYKAPRVAGIPSKLRIIYFYGPIHPWSEPKYYLEAIEEGVRYKATFWDPRTAQHTLFGLIKADKEHRWRIPVLPTFEDWVLLLESTEEELPLPPFEEPIPMYKKKMLILKKILRKIKQKLR